MNNRELIEYFISEINRLNLNDNNVLSKFSIDEMADDWNGVGGEKESKIIIKIFSWLGRNYFPAFFIHDLEFTIGGTEEQFHQTNQRLCDNLKIMVADLYSKWDIRYYIRQPICHLVKFLCDNFGFENWLLSKSWNLH